ncbi:acyclic terpene utilization AtuA family protein [Rhodoferax sp. TBRC 17660]|uniref:Acyclic terpene utilization AtuA family protein n=1 Tax=Rhodoferax potami TaxID=3068338 RepID=A0ABU3KST3_9BURK|nr:acyclic terpene utilization AtuA family protein [Rhodoferax sp. TBRC 17660]MDT7520393.1 acyclic terpene utilization AtuA family protein [Rhodoferax sp. TBRC 17660]
MVNNTPFRIGCAAGFSGDRTDAALPVVRSLIASGLPSFLMFETLAERTLALAQLARRTSPDEGYEPLLVDLLEPVLGLCLDHGIRIVSNFGAANPSGAATRIKALAQKLGLRAPRVAVVEGDDLSGLEHRAVLERALGASMPTEPMVSANAYIGAQSIAGALRAGAEVVVCGRVADPSLVLGPALAHFGWATDDWDRLARATMAGHLLECGAQVTGGYFADPGYKDVPDLAQLGYPIAEIDVEGHCTITKPVGTGGCINEQTVKEQLLYELHDPSSYLTPDVIADITQATVRSLGPDTVRLEGVKGHARPEHLKVNVCFESGWFAEGEISYAGPRAENRARLAARVLQERLQHIGALRIDLIGVTSVLGDDHSRWLASSPGSADTSRDVRLRVAMQHPQRDSAQKLIREVTALYTCGPAGGGGVRTALRPRLGTVSCLVPRTAVTERFRMVD